MKNNFDQSSTGVNIQLSIFWDTDIARHEFEENFREIGNEQYFYTACDEHDFKGKYKINNKKEFVNFVYNEYGYDTLQYTKSELMKWDKSELLNQFEDIIDEADGVSERYEKHISRGYSQGDYAEVFYDPEKLNRNVEKYIDHLLWDSPLYARLEIDGDEYFIDEYIKDRYNYDQDEILKTVKRETKHHKKHKIIVEWVEQNLPDSPDYL